MNEEKIIIYGAGKRGNDYYKFLKSKNLDNYVAAFCDKRANEIKEKFGKPVILYEDALKLNLPFLIGVGIEFVDELKKLFAETGVTRYYEYIADWASKYLPIGKSAINREYCAFCHIDDMDEYFKASDNVGALSVYWGDTFFYRMFSRLDKKNIVELACGRGRHVPKYISMAEHVTLVDILEKNIDICKERFKDYNNIDYYKNNGYDLQELPDNTYTALFTYDAMVHFELLDIAKYLMETYRILINGGMALFHHSNYHADYKVSFVGSPGGRNYMSKDIFAYLAYRAGFEIVEQRVFDLSWSNQNLDCLTLVRKNI